VAYSPRWINNSVSYISLCGTKFKCVWLLFFNCDRMFCAIFVVVSVVSRILFGRSWVRIEARARDFSLLQNVHTGPWGPPSPLLRGYQDSLTEVKLAWTCSPPLNCIDYQGSVRRELYLHSHYTPSWCEQWRIFLLVLLILTPLITAMKAL